MATVTSRENAQKSVFTGRHVRHTSVVSHDNETVGGILVLQILSFLLFLENLHSCWARG